MEIWKSLKNFENKYEISNMGNIRSIDHVVLTLDGCLIKAKGKLILGHIDKQGYKRVSLKDLKTSERKNFLVHRLVAETFLDNPNNYPVVNHKDENKLNNHVDNLEWCTLHYNCTYNKGARDTLKRKIIEYSLEGKFLKIWDCIADAARFYHIEPSSISLVVKNKGYTSANKIWKYYTENYPLIIDVTNMKFRDKRVAQYSLDGQLINVWKSISEAGRNTNSNFNTISISCKYNDYHSANNYIWRYVTQEPPKEKIIIPKNPNVGNQRRVNQFDLLGNYIQTFNSINSACNAVKGKSASCITSCCRGLLKTAYGFIWQYDSNTESSIVKEIPIKSKKVLRYSKKGLFLDEWESIRKASKELGIRESGIVTCCKGTSKSAGGYIWKYYTKNYPKQIDEYSRSTLKVALYDLNNNLIKIWSNAREATLTLNIGGHSLILDCCKGKLKTAKGFIWKYV